jgi:tetratricopeptide (TPR) repeat protein
MYERIRRFPLVIAMLAPAAMVACTSAAQDAHSQHGHVAFETSCNAEAQAHFQRGLSHLHHMMYDQARPEFDRAAEADDRCAMAHWGIAMASFQPLWHPTPSEGLERGRAAISTARSIGTPTEREAGYLSAAAAFFADPDPAESGRAADHRARIRAWERAQRSLHERYPDDVDAAAFYALAQVAHATALFSPTEARDYSRQIRAGALLEGYFDDHPDHPGLYHYLIHAYDSPALAERAEAAARAYDQLAPETTHALHMPSHIFVRLGRWEETAELNARSAEAALGHPANGMTSMHYPHALDYMMYAYLQMGDDDGARETLRRVEDIYRSEGTFAAAYGIAAARARFHLERGEWAEAARLEPRTPQALAWEEHPAAEALIHYARGLGAARSDDPERAAAERERIAEAVTTLRDAGDDYWAYTTEALGQAVQAWILYERGDTDEALALMSAAADLEESMDKHPITPGEVLPVRELHAALLAREGRVDESRTAYQRSLERTPNRRNAMTGLERLVTVER